MVSRGDVWLVLAADGAANAEPHPCVILSPPEIHDYLGVVTIAPISQTALLFGDFIRSVRSRWAG